MAASLAALPGNEVLFASEYGRRDFSLPGVKRVLLKKPKDRKKAAASISTPALDAGERDWTMAYLRGRIAMWFLSARARRSASIASGKAWRRFPPA